VPGDDLADHAEPGLDVTELPVAVGGLVQVHEVHVDRRPRQRLVGLRVQVQQRLLQRVEAVDPHPGGRERVHPGDHADAVRVGVGREHRAVDARRVGEDRLPGELDGQDRPELLRDLLRLLRDLLQRLLAVEPLAAREEPHLPGHLELPCWP
jgi:hypothetical protein